MIAVLLRRIQPVLQRLQQGSIVRKPRGRGSQEIRGQAEVCPRYETVEQYRSSVVVFLAYFLASKLAIRLVWHDANGETISKSKNIVLSLIGQVPDRDMIRVQVTRDLAVVYMLACRKTAFQSGARGGWYPGDDIQGWRWLWQNKCNPDLTLWLLKMGRTRLVSVQFVGCKTYVVATALVTTPAAVFQEKDSRSAEMYSASTVSVCLGCC